LSSRDSNKKFDPISVEINSLFESDSISIMVKNEKKKNRNRNKN
jgi:hypothetical protein